MSNTSTARPGWLPLPSVVKEMKWNDAINTYNQLIGLNKEKEGQWQQAIVGLGS